MVFYVSGTNFRYNGQQQPSETNGRLDSTPSMRYIIKQVINFWLLWNTQYEKIQILQSFIQIFKTSFENL